MEFTFNCMRCASKLKVPHEDIGMSGVCPECGAEMTVPDFSLSPGMEVGGFRIERLLGRGGMGEGYLATQLSLDREIALKILRASLANQEGVIGEFLKETRMVARLNHPHVVTAYEAGEDKGIYFLAMAYVSGASVDRRIVKDGPLSETVALRIAREIASALEYAWDHVELIHRDVTPANILLDPEGRAKLSDLGLAALSVDTGTLQDAEWVMGTLNYLSPERMSRYESVMRSQISSSETSPQGTRIQLRWK